MNINRFKGLGIAIVTPFRPDGSVDFKALENFLDFLISNDVDYLVALGTTSEAATMTDDERVAVVDFIIEINKGRVPLIVGCGGNNTRAVVTELKALNKPGVDGILSVVPYYNKPNQRGLFEHFKAIANVTNLPVILYNVPGRTSSNLSAETTLVLAKKFKNIIAIKEASGDMSQVMQIVKNKPDNFLVLSGDDALTLPSIAIGFDGVISVVGNAYPKQFGEMVNAALNGNQALARKIHYQLIDIIESMFAEGNPAGVKAYLKYLGLMEASLRLPLLSVSDELNTKIIALAKTMD